MKKITEFAKNYSHVLLAFIKWTAISTLTGAVCGCVGAAFHYAVNFATATRQEHPYLIFFLPVAGVLIVLMYRLLRTQNNMGTDYIIDSVRTTDNIPILLAPLIFVGTFLTHLCGGSAGREGAALQLGGSIAQNIGRILRLDSKDMSLIVLSGMSGVFAALFGTPLTATLFALEVVSVGIIYYSGSIPCLVSSLVSYSISRLLGVNAEGYKLNNVPEFDAIPLLKVAVLAALCAILSIVFCKAMKYSRIVFARLVKNPFLRAFCGGICIVLLSLIFSSHDYNGAGMDIIEKAIGGNAVPWAFAVKMLFTAITIGCGFKGGEIVPCFFIGSTFGCIAGSLLGLDAGFGAAIGLISLFCGSVNCPIASLFLSIELFGQQGIIFFALACAVSYILSGYSGLYDTQKIVYSKLRAEYINITAE